MELLPAYQAPVDLHAAEYEREREQDRLDYLYEQGDRPDLWPPSPQDFPQSDTGPSLTPVREARTSVPWPAVDSLSSVVAAGQGIAPTVEGD